MTFPQEWSRGSPPRLPSALASLMCRMLLLPCTRTVVGNGRRAVPPVHFRYCPHLPEMLIEITIDRVRNTIDQEVMMPKKKDTSDMPSTIERSDRHAQQI
jgi:hypothetical protein